MPRPRHDISSLTPQQLDAEITRVTLHLQDATIGREQESAHSDASDDAPPRDPDPWERTLIERLAHLRGFRKERLRSCLSHPCRRPP